MKWVVARPSVYSVKFNIKIARFTKYKSSETVFFSLILLMDIDALVNTIPMFQELMVSRKWVRKNR